METGVEKYGMQFVNMCLDMISILVEKCTPVGSVTSVVIGGYGFKPRRVMSIVF